MAARSVLGPKVNCYNVDAISLSEDALVSQGAYLCSASHDYNDSGFPLITAPIQLKRNSWVCAEAFVGPGVIVEKGGVVGARSVVTRNVEEMAIVAGNPAKQVGRRDQSAIREVAK
jgi:putative colanic acid biosynthesis acetyltransferase WcaF